MKRIILEDDYTEIDLKPSSFINEYIELSKKSVSDYFTRGAKLRDCLCPACQGKEFTVSFNKFGLRYVECVHCHTLYINPRPEDSVIREYYKRSDASHFWRERLPTLTAKKRDEKIIKPRFHWILDSTKEYLPDVVHFVDINTNQYGYISEMEKTDFFVRKTILNPFICVDDIRSHSRLEFIKEPLDSISIKGVVDVISLFEVADHYSDVNFLFTKVNEMLKPNGLCFITAILISGFDLQILWEHAENLFPPDRMNVFSVEGFQTLFERHRFECLEFSTPGILDLDIVERTMEHDRTFKVPRFVECLLRNKMEGVRQSFQQFLQESLLSSYARILIRKK